MNQLAKAYPDYLFVSGVTSFGYCYFDLDYQDGLERCLWLLDHCDEAWVFGNYTDSKGCMAEIEFCQQHRIPYYFKPLEGE